MKSSTLLALAVSTAMAATVAHARITKIEIDCAISQSPSFCPDALPPNNQPTFEGRTFGSVGTYEKLRGKAYGEVDPHDRRNRVITDIELAPRNARGKVEYSMDIYILKPVNLRDGNDKLFMEVNNRGGKLFGAFNGSSGGNDPTTAAHAGDAFLMNQGYSMAWNGWDPSAPAGNNSLTLTVPVATHRDGSTITGRSYEYIVFDNAATTQSTLAYPAANPADKASATLTVRDRLRDSGELITTIPPSGWEYTSAAGTAIRLLPAGTPFKQSAIYEFSYTAKNPFVAGLGFAATRDFVSFLRHAKADDYGNPNPLARQVKHTYTFSVSQPARYLNDFETLGFNEDERGSRVIDGILNWIGGGSGIGMHVRFAQPGRTERNRQNHRYPEANFPFTYERFKDPYSKGDKAGRGDRCEKTDTCAKSLQVNSANEYWVKAGSLLHTDPLGRDLEDDPDYVRFYLLSSVEHTVAGSNANPPGQGNSCQQIRNTTDPNPALRALFIALDEWVSEKRKPPSSQVPTRSTAAYSMRLDNGVGFVPQAALGFPSIPGVTYSGLITVRHKFDFGPRYDDGIMDVNPPGFSGPVYPSFVSKVDADGNDVAGIRLPAVSAPIATTTGWALRAPNFGGGPWDGCEASGQWIAFKKTQIERMAAGDPRRSLEERYGNHQGYVDAVAAAARALEARRFLLPADVQRYIDAAQASSVLQP
jgi:Alpha/beta hydrolase domain